MDVFQPGHQFGDFDFQLEDNNPGVSEQGLLWTMPIPKDSVGMNIGGGEAFFCLSDAQMPDFGNLLNAFWGGGASDAEGLPLPPVFSSTITLDARWFNAGAKQRVRDPVNRFIYDNAQTSASIKWTSLRRGAKFESDDAGQEVQFAAIGIERNGTFF
jgi:hypothetical protein